MSLSPNTPNEPVMVEPAGLPRWVTLLFVAAFALVAYLLYASYAERQALQQSADEANKKTQALAAEVDKANARIADLKGLVDVTLQKLQLSEDEIARARGWLNPVRRTSKQATPSFASRSAKFSRTRRPSSDRWPPT